MLTLESELLDGRFVHFNQIPEAWHIRLDPFNVLSTLRTQFTTRENPIYIISQSDSADFD